MSATLTLDLFRPPILDPVKDNKQLRGPGFARDRTPRRVPAPGGAEGQRSAGAFSVVRQGGGPTLDDLVVGAWEGLAASRTVACLACGEASMTPRWRRARAGRRALPQLSDDDRLTGAPGGRSGSRQGRGVSRLRRPYRLQPLSARAVTLRSVSTPDGCGGEKSRRGKSGHHRAWWSAQVDPVKAAGKCHRDIPPMAGPHVSSAQARVKRCGKSAPPSWRHGVARQTPPGARPSRTVCRLPAEVQVGRVDGWSSKTRSGLQAC